MGYFLGWEWTPTAAASWSKSHCLALGHGQVTNRIRKSISFTGKVLHDDIWDSLSLPGSNGCFRSPFKDEIALFEGFSSGISSVGALQHHSQAQEQSRDTLMSLLSSAQGAAQHRRASPPAQGPQK